MKRTVTRVDHPIVQKKINKSLDISIREGSAASVSAGLGLSYLSPFALLLNATATQMGILHAIISLLPSLVQLRVTKLIRKFSRKRIVLIAIMLRILTWIPIILTGALFYFGVLHMSWVLIILVGVAYSFSAIANPAWFSWMGSLVPEHRRGKYFSRRNRIAGFFGITTMIIGAIVLDGAKRVGANLGDVIGFTLLGFGFIFTLSMIARIWSWLLLRKQYEPRLKVRKKDYFTLGQFWDKIRTTPFGRFCLFRFYFSFVVGIAGPFWVVYMLRDLGFCYVWYMAITVSAVVFQLIFLPLLGKFSDRFGNVKLMRVCSWMIAATTMLWFLSSFIGNGLMLKLYLLFVPGIVGGFGWAGYNLAVNNYVYDAVGSRKRSFGLVYMNLMVGVGMFLGASFGSLLAWVDVSFMNSMVFIFVISMIGRGIVSMFGMRLLREVRYVKKFAPRFLLHEFGPAHGVVREFHHLGHLVGKVEHYVEAGEKKEFEEKDS
ncbi:hypothetical protein K8R30_00940 [archaeon]|nr:hypothetical protein [archaeon]